MKTLFSKAFEMLLNLGRALKPRDLQKEVDEAKQLVKDVKNRIPSNKAKLQQLKDEAIQASTSYMYDPIYDSNLN